MFRVVIAHSEDIDAEDAVEEILAQAREQLGSDAPAAGLLFSCIDQEHEQILRAVCDAFPGIQLIGCTTDGELSSLIGFTEDSVNLILFVSDEVEMVAGVARDVSKDPDGALTAAVQEALGGLTKEPALAFFTPTGLTASGSVMVEALQRALGDGVPLFGGTAGDQWKFEKTLQFCGDAAFLDAAPFLILTKPLKFGAAARSGWKPVGNPGTVTEVTGNVVYRIDDMTAIEFYRRYMGDGAMDHLGEFPLAVLSGDEGFYLRAALFGSEEQGTITFAGDVDQGATVQLTQASRDEIVRAAREAVEVSASSYPGTAPAAAMIFSCAGRKSVLGTRTAEEYLLLRENFPELRLAGFYTYGEIAPMDGDRRSCFHNETFVSLLLGTE